MLLQHVHAKKSEINQGCVDYNKEMTLSVGSEDLKLCTHSQAPLCIYGWLVKIKAH